MGMKHEFKIPKMSEQAARNMAEKAWDSYREKYAQYQPTFGWKSPGLACVSFKANGVEIKGTLALQPEKIVLDMEVPFLLRSFMPRALQAIEEEITKWIPKTTQKPVQSTQGASKPTQGPPKNALPKQGPPLPRNPSPQVDKTRR